MAIKNNRTRPAFYHRARRKIVEELAQLMIIDELSEGGDVPLPNSMHRDAVDTKNMLLNWFSEDRADEENR